MRYHALLCVLAAAVVPLAGCAATSRTSPRLPGDVTVLQHRPDRLIAQLPNGLIVIAQEVRTAPVVSAQVWIKTGSIYEQEFVGAGLSHFLEHLLSGGSTATRSEDQIKRILGSIGAQTNAMTGLDGVHYYIDTSSAYTAEAIDLLSDYLQHNLIRPEEFAREREVIQNEFSRGEGDPHRIFWKLTQQTRYQAHPARHPTIGYLDEFLRISRDQIHAFYRRMYVPNNMVFVVVGDIDRAAVVAQVRRLWADSPAQRLPSIAFPVEPPIAAPRQAAAAADIRRPRLRLAWPGTRVGEPGDYALDLLAMVLGRGESSRLVRIVRDRDRSVYSVSAYNASFHWGRGLFAIDADVVAGPPNAPPDAAPDPAALDQGLARAKADILAVVRDVVRQGIRPEELARAQRQTIAGVVYESQTANDLAERLASDMIGTGDPDYLERYARAIEAVTAPQVQAAAEAFLRDDRLLTITLLPLQPGQVSADLPRPPELPGAAALPRETVELDNAGVVARFEAAAAQAPARAEPPRVDPVRRSVLPNGLRLIVGRDTKLPMVAMQFYHLGGLLAEGPQDQGLAHAAARMMMRGTASRSAQDIARQIEDLGAGLGVECGNNTWFSRAVCLKADWRTVLEIQADVILRPGFPDDEWGKLQPRLLAAIERQRDTGDGELRLHFLADYFRGHSWSTTPLGRAEVVARLTPADLRRFHQQHLGADQAVLAVFGDVDPEAVAREAARLFADLPARAAAPFAPPPPPPAQPRVIEHPTGKPLVGVEIGYGPGLVRASPDYAPMRVLDKVLSSFPSGWLDEALRGKGPGLVYAVGAGQITGIVPGCFLVYFNTSPAQLDEALTRSRSVIERLRADLVPDEDLRRAQAAVLVDEYLGKQSVADRAADAALDAIYSLPADESERFQRRVQQITAGELQAVARKYLNDPVTVILKGAPATQPAAAP